MLKFIRSVATLTLATLLGALAVHAQSLPAGCASGSLVNAPAGPVCGTSVSAAGESVFQYLGIPYAEPPVGNLRWKNPVQKAVWASTQPMTKTSNICYQAPPPSYAQNVCPSAPKLTQSEDCLYLNVWVPSGASTGSKLPVMVFIHGGAFVIGSGAAGTYNGSYLAASGNVIVVTINYRLGPFGFLALNGITDANNNNFGFRDQIMALQWVQSNIGSFGGDPSKVTIFGESAGAMSVGLHVFSSPQSAGLFKGAIMESNPLGVPYKLLGNASQPAMGTAYAIGESFQTQLGCSTASCVMNAQVSDILNAQKEMADQLPVIPINLQDLMAWAPAIDGTLITNQPADSAGSLTKPMILGTNQAEGTVFFSMARESVNLNQDTLSGLAYRGYLAALFPEQVSNILNLSTYSCPFTSTNCIAQMRQVLTDYFFSCPNRSLAQAIKPNIPLYAYEFTQITSTFNLWAGYNVDACATQVCHGEELPYVFNTPQGVCPTYSFSPQEAALSQSMADYWTSFATSQNPNGGSHLTWPQFGPNLTYLILNQPPSTQNDPFGANANCSFWDSIGYGSSDVLKALLAISTGKS